MLQGQTDVEAAIPADSTLIGRALLVTSEQLADAMLKSAAFHELRVAAATS